MLASRASRWPIPTLLSQASAPIWKRATVPLRHSRCQPPRRRRTRCGTVRRPSDAAATSDLHGPQVSPAVPLGAPARPPVASVHVAASWRPREVADMIGLEAPISATSKGVPAAKRRRRRRGSRGGAASQTTLRVGTVAAARARRSGRRSSFLALADRSLTFRRPARGAGLAGKGWRRQVRALPVSWTRVRTSTCRLSVSSNGSNSGSCRATHRHDSL